MMEKRIVEQFKVKKLEFFMGDNDPVDIRCGGPARLALWVYTSLPDEVINEVAKDQVVQEVIQAHGGYGNYFITEAWAEHFCGTKDELRNKLIELAKQF